ncbi:MAG TPA: hypothetical protein VLT62_11420 [Candidatus Methylomirabilis sp.]|nr:hypothetical protein [Candidatus Methylomirabilis sp.]
MPARLPRNGRRDVGLWAMGTTRLRGVRRGLRRVIRALLSWASLFAIPVGIGTGLKGYKTLGALLILGGTLAYFLVDPIMMVLDLKPSDESE